MYMKAESQQQFSLVSIFIFKLTYFKGEEQSATQKCVFVKTRFNNSTEPQGHLTFVDQWLFFSAAESTLCHTSLGRCSEFYTELISE